MTFRIRKKENPDILPSHRHIVGILIITYLDAKLLIIYLTAKFFHIFYFAIQEKKRNFAQLNILIHFK